MNTFFDGSTNSSGTARGGQNVKDKCTRCLNTGVTCESTDLSRSFGSCEPCLKAGKNTSCVTNTDQNDTIRRKRTAAAARRRAAAKNNESAEQASSSNTCQIESSQSNNALENEKAMRLNWYREVMVDSVEKGLSGDSKLSEAEFNERARALMSVDNSQPSQATAARAFGMSDAEFKELLDSLKSGSDEP